MKVTTFGQTLLIGVVVIAATRARGSDPTGIYAVVEKITAEPDWNAPEKVKIYGVFALAKGSGDNYEPAARGYLYYSLNPKKPEVSKKEWQDMKKIAGKGECIGFTFRYDEKGKVRDLSDKPDSPVPYPVAMGLQKIRPTWYEPILQVLTFPRPASPGDAAEVEPGKTLLAVHAATVPSREEGDESPHGHGRGSSLEQPDKEKLARGKAEYFFEIQNESGQKESSPALAAEGPDVKWTPAMTVKPGARYTWKAWLVAGKFHGPEAKFEFKGKPGV